MTEDDQTAKVQAALNHALEGLDRAHSLLPPEPSRMHFRRTPVARLKAALANADRYLRQAVEISDEELDERTITRQLNKKTRQDAPGTPNGSAMKEDDVPLPFDA